MWEWFFGFALERLFASKREPPLPQEVEVRAFDCGNGQFQQAVVLDRENYVQLVQTVREYGNLLRVLVRTEGTEVEVIDTSMRLLGTLPSQDAQQFLPHIWRIEEKKRYVACLGSAQLGSDDLDDYQLRLDLDHAALAEAADEAGSLPSQSTDNKTTGQGCCLGLIVLFVIFVVIVAVT